MAIYRFKNPVRVGDLSQSIEVQELQLASVSVNFQNHYAKNGTAILSVVLEDLASGHKLNVVYNDADALALWQELDTIDGRITLVILNKLQADGKLPPGAIE
jgi:hypothetical protein